MDQVIVSLARDPQFILVLMVGLLGLMFLRRSASRQLLATRWLAGSALLFGALQGGAVLAGTFMALDPGVRGWLQTVFGVPVLASISAGVVSLYRPARQSIRAFWGFVVGAPMAVLLLNVVAGSNPHSGSLVSATCIGGLALWAYIVAPHQAPAGAVRSKSLALALGSFPATLVLGLLAELPLAEARALLSIPIGIIFVVLLTLILQHDAHLVSLELAEKVQAQEALRRLNETLEQEVARRTEQLQRINQGLQSFAGMVSHDLRAPVRNIAGLVQMATKDLQEGRHDALESMLALMAEESHRASTMVVDLLHLARLENHELGRTQVNMDALVAECVRSLALQYPGAREAVVIEPLPVVSADAGLMRHVVTNLLSNALKFGAETPALRIRVSAQKVPGHWRFEVQDNGPGFDAARAQELFKPFVRLGNTQASGTGLGLTVVQRAVEMHGGAVGAWSEAGQGALFWWTMPAEEPSTETAATRSATA